MLLLDKPSFPLAGCHHVSIQPSTEMLPGMSWSLKCGVHGICLDSQTLSGQLLCIVSVLINLCQCANKAGPLVVSRYGNLLRVRRETEQRACIVKCNILIKYNVNLYV